jgi:WD repeat-containing protein 35
MKYFQASDALQGLLSEETTGSGGVSDTQLIDNVWRPAEAYHFYILAQRQFKSNNADNALRSALTLTEYEDILPVQTIYNLIGNSRSNMFQCQTSRENIK